MLCTTHEHLKQWLVFLRCWFRGVNNVICHQFSSLCHRVQWKHCNDPLLYLASLVQGILMSVRFLSYDRSTLSLNPEPCISSSLLSESHWLPRPWFFPFRDRSVILVSFLACHWEPIRRLTCSVVWTTGGTDEVNTHVYKWNRRM